MVNELIYIKGQMTVKTNLCSTHLVTLILIERENMTLMIFDWPRVHSIAN